jgi:hypothetical protein
MLRRRIAALSFVTVSAAVVLGSAACSKTDAKGGATPPPSGALPADEGETVPPDDQLYTLTVEPPTPVAPGQAAVARVKVVPAAGYKMTREAPNRLTLEPSAGVTLAKNSFELPDAEAFDDKQLVFAVSATPQAAGEHKVEGQIKFAVCKAEDMCISRKGKVSFSVAAK